MKYNAIAGELLATRPRVQLSPTRTCKPSRVICHCKEQRSSQTRAVCTFRSMVLHIGLSWLRRRGVSGADILGATGRVHWLTPYAPLGLNEAQAIVSHASNLSSLSDEDFVVPSPQGLVKVLKYYYDVGIRSYNMAIYSGPFGENLDYFDVGLRVVSRYGYKPKFVSDVWAFQYLLGGQEVYEAPEETCSKLRKYFE